MHVSDKNVLTDLSGVDGQVVPGCCFSIQKVSHIHCPITGINSEHLSCVTALWNAVSVQGKQLLFGAIFLVYFPFCVCWFFYHIQISTMHKQQVNQIIMDCLTKHIYGMANIMYSVLQIQNLLVCFSRLLQIYKQLYKTRNPTREIGNRGNTYA